MDLQNGVIRTSPPDVKTQLIATISSAQCLEKFPNSTPPPNLSAKHTTRLGGLMG